MNELDSATAGVNISPTIKDQESNAETNKLGLVDPRRTSLLPKPKDWGLGYRTGWHVEVNQKEIVSGDPNSNKELQNWLSKWLVLYLQRIEPQFRAVFLIDLKLFFDEAASAREDESWKNADYKSAFRQFFSEKYGFSRTDSNRILSFLIKFNQKYPVELSFEKLLSGKVFEAVSENGDYEAGVRAYLDEADSLKVGERVRQDLINGGYSILKMAGDFDLVVVYPEITGLHQWDFAKQNALNMLSGEFRANELTDKEFIDAVLYVHHYGFTNRRHKAAQLITSVIASHARDDHPEFIKIIADRAREYQIQDTQRLKLLKKLYLDYLAYALHVQQIFENGGVEYVVSEADRNRLKIIRGAFEGKFRIDMNRLRGPIPNMDSFSEEAREFRHDKTTDARRTLATALTAQAIGGFSKNLRLISELYFKKDEDSNLEPDSKPKPNIGIFVKDSASAIRFSQIISRVIYQKPDLSSFALLDEIFRELQQRNLVPSNLDFSKDEFVILACFQIIRFLTPSKSENREFIKIFQTKILPVLDVIHDSTGLNTRELIDEVSEETYEVGKTRAEKSWKDLFVARDGVTSSESEEVKQILEKFSIENKRWLDFFKKIAYRSSISNFKAPYPEEAYNWPKRILQIGSIIYWGTFGYQFGQQIDSGEAQRFFESLVKVLTFTELGNREVWEFIATLIIYASQIIAGLITISYVNSTLKVQLYSKIISNASMLIENSLNELKTHRPEIQKKARSVLTSILLLISLAFSIGVYKDELVDFGVELYNQGAELFEGTDQDQPSSLGGWNSEENLTVSNSKEGVRTSEPEFIAYGAENYGDLFWVGKICDWERGSLICNSFANDSYLHREDHTPQVNFESRDIRRSKLLLRTAYQVDDVEKYIQDNFVSRGAIVRKNLNIDEGQPYQYFEIPSGFMPATVLVHEEDRTKILTEYEEGKGVAVLVVDGQNLEHDVFIVYEPIRVFDDGVIFEFGRSLEVTGTLHYSPQVFLFSDIDDLRFNRESVDDWWYGNDVRVFKEIGGEALYYKDTHFPAFFDTVYAITLRRLHQFEEISISATLKYEDGTSTQVNMPEDVLPEQFIDMLKHESKFVVWPTTDSNQFLVALLLPNEAQMFINSIYLSREGGLAENPNYEDLRISLDLNPNRANDDNVFALSIPSRPNSSNTSVVAEANPPLDFNEDIPLDPYILTESVRNAYFRLEGNHKSINTPIAASMLYSAMILDSYKYGFSDFASVEGETPVDTFNRLMAASQDGLPLVPEQVCNQFAFDIYMILRSLGYQVKIASGYSHIDGSNFGGMSQLGHQLLVVYNYETGLWELFDSTLPTENGVAEELPAGDLSNEGLSTGIYITGTLALALVLKSGLDLTSSLISKLKNEINIDLAWEKSVANTLFEDVEKIFSDLNDVEQTSLYYALTACMGFTVGGSPRPTGELSIYSTDELPSAKEVDTEGWAGHDLDINKVTDYVIDMMRGRSKLFDPNSSKQELMRLNNQLKANGIRYLGKNSPRLRAYFERRFRSAINFNNVIINPENQALLNIRSLADSLNRKDDKSAKKIAKALFEFHKLITN